jgi:hypothetical protein
MHLEGEDVLYYIIDTCTQGAHQKQYQRERAPLTSLTCAPLKGKKLNCFKKLKEKHVG